MTQVTPEEITHLAALARLTLSPSEAETVAVKLPEIVSFVDELNNVTVASDVRRPEAVSLDQLRADEVKSDSLKLEQLEKLAPSFDKDQIVVPAVFGEATDA